MDNDNEQDNYEYWQFNCSKSFLNSSKFNSGYKCAYMQNEK